MIIFEVKKGVGIDIVEISRFSEIVGETKSSSLNKLFTEEERKYGFSYKDPAPHFAGMFAAKEAVSKACGVYIYPVLEIEIRHAKDGAPLAFYKNEEMGVSISIAHTSSIATAIAVIY